MSFDEPNFDDGTEVQPPEESNNNRTFMIAVGILGGIILISVACLVGVYLFGRNRINNGTQQAQVSANSTATAAAFINQALTATFEGLISLPTTTSTPVPTSVVKAVTATSTTNPSAAGTVSAAGTPAAATATVGAALTQAAAAQLTVVPTTTALPTTGFADEFGLPGLVVMALAFVIVILLARRLRTTPALNR
jgi:cytoskeletal protein RodZ